MKKLKKAYKNRKNTIEAYHDCCNCGCGNYEVTAQNRSEKNLAAINRK